MKTPALAVLLSLAVAIAAAPPGVALATPTQVVLAQTRHADVDGDGRADTVRLYKAGKSGDNTIWKVKVTTAAGRSSSVTIKIPSYRSLTGMYGWANLDGRRGAEVLLSPQTDDFEIYLVLTWRDGALHRESAPLGPGDATKRQNYWETPSEIDRSGYRFSTSSGRRYVNTWYATCPGQPDKPGRCTVKTVRSVWRDGDWHKVAVLPTTKVANSAIYARHPFGALKIHSWH